MVTCQNHESKEAVKEDRQMHLCGGDKLVNKTMRDMWIGGLE